MDFKLKHIATALAALTMSCTAFAGTYEPPAVSCIAPNVSIPCERTGWDIAGEFIYVEPMNDDYWAAERNTVTATTNQVEQVFIDPGFDIGFRIEGSYHFSTGNDFTANWLYFNNGDNAQLAVDPTVAGQSINLRVNDSVVVLTANSIGAHTHNSLDVVNLEMGQHIDVGNDVDMRYHFGVQYIDLDHESRVSAFDAAATPAKLGEVFTESKYSGIGPRFGVDVAYALGNSFSAIARGSVAILVGDLDTQARVNRFVVGNLSETDFPEATERLFAPTMSSKLGLNYSFDCMDGVFFLEGGWQFHSFRNVIRNRLTDLANGSGVMQATSNFGIHGPYVMVKYLA